MALAVRLVIFWTWVGPSAASLDHSRYVAKVMPIFVAPPGSAGSSTYPPSSRRVKARHVSKLSSILFILGRGKRTPRLAAIGCYLHLSASGIPGTPGSPYSRSPRLMRATFPSVFAVDLLQMQRRAIPDAILGCRGPVPKFGVAAIGNGRPLL